MRPEQPADDAASMGRQIRTESEAHRRAQDPAPCHRGRSTDEQRRVEGRCDTGTEAHDAEREADLGTNVSDWVAGTMNAGTYGGDVGELALEGRDITNLEELVVVVEGVVAAGGDGAGICLGILLGRGG